MTGYRDGISSGKEVALQEGFDAAFACSGAPRGRELGVLRGLATAHLLPHLPLLPRRPARVLEIVDKLAAGRFRPNEEATVLHSAGADAQGKAHPLTTLRALRMQLESVLLEAGLNVPLGLD
ncbi:hypothetical protein EDB89DRAFT_2024320 [Lactarius sanguifluus]|nr:hypothetical protein EDB89DRAFT_2024320 [Lactarius sanguifluus]